MGASQDNGDYLLLGRASAAEMHPLDGCEKVLVNVGTRPDFKRDLAVW